MEDCHAETARDNTRIPRRAVNSTNGRPTTTEPTEDCRTHRFSGDRDPLRVPVGPPAPGLRHARHLRGARAKVRSRCPVQDNDEASRAGYAFRRLLSRTGRVRGLHRRPRLDAPTSLRHTTGKAPGQVAGSCPRCHLGTRPRKPPRGCGRRSSRGPFVMRGSASIVTPRNTAPFGDVGRYDPRRTRTLPRPMTPAGDTCGGEAPVSGGTTTLSTTHHGVKHRGKCVLGFAPRRVRSPHGAARPPRRSLLFPTFSSYA